MELFNIDVETASKGSGVGAVVAAAILGIFNLINRAKNNDGVSVVTSAAHQKALDDQMDINKLLFKKLDDQRENLNAHKVEIAKDYVDRDEFSVFRSHIDARFDQQQKILYDISNALIHRK